jgi:hypothetical protein
MQAADFLTSKVNVYALGHLRLLDDTPANTIGMWKMQSGEIHMRRFGFVAALVVLGVTSALGAAGPAPLPPPDPTAKNLTPYRIQLRAFDACLVTQSRLKGTTREAVHTPCSCYAKGTVNAMSKSEIQAFRDTGYFNDTAREKALGFVDTCKLARPS